MMKNYVGNFSKIVFLYRILISLNIKITWFVQPDCSENKHLVKF